MYIKFKIFEEAMADAGNSNGMGAVVAPQVSAIPGDVAGSIAGSGDLPAYDTGTSFDINPYQRRKKPKKKKTKKKKSIYDKSVKYFTIKKFTDMSK